jgi:predicted nucleic acid-binding protein
LAVTSFKARLKTVLGKHRLIGIDSNILIYWIEDNKKYASLLEPFFDWLDQRGNSGVTSTLTMLEILVKPYRDSALTLVDSFYGLLVTYPNLKWKELTLPIADLAAKMRADYGLRTPDAIQIATAMEAGASAFLANDLAFQHVASIEVLIVDRIPES